MKSLIVFAATLLLATAAFAQPPDDEKVLREQIDRLEVEWNTINELSDSGGKRRLLSEDSYHVGPSGRKYNKVQDIRAAADAFKARKPGQSVRFEITDKIIRIFTDVAVVTGTGRQFKTEGATTKEGNLFRFVHVWEKREAGWHLIVDQVTSVQ